MQRHQIGASMSLRHAEHEPAPLPDEPTVSLLHHEPPICPQRFFGNRPFLFGATIAAVVTLALLAAWDRGRILLEVDRPVARWVADNRTDAWTHFFNVASHFGDNIVVFSAAAIAAAFTWRHCHALSLALIGAALFRPGMEFVLKDVIGRIRPDVEPLGTFHGPSHPSGHPMAAASFFGLMPAVTALFHANRKLWTVVTALSLTIPVFVAAARVYKGAHWMSDVVASLLWAALYLLAVQGAFDKYHFETDCVQGPRHDADTEPVHG